MDKIATKVEQNFQVTISLTEDEAAALYDIVMYGYDEFMNVFKEKLGKSYIEKHEKGAKSLFKFIASEMPMHLARITEARRLFNDSKFQKK